MFPLLLTALSPRDLRSSLVLREEDNLFLSMRTWRLSSFYMLNEFDMTTYGKNIWNKAQVEVQLCSSQDVPGDNKVRARPKNAQRLPGTLQWIF